MQTCGFSHILPWSTYIFCTKFFYLSGFLLDVTQSVEVQTLPLWSKPGAMQTAWQRWATFIVLSFFLQAATPYDLSPVQCCRAFWSTNKQHCRESTELSVRYIDEWTAYVVFFFWLTARGAYLILDFFRSKRLFEAGRPLSFIIFGGSLLECGCLLKLGVVCEPHCS